MTESGSVGAWDSGPFDNDAAADFANELDGVDPNQRISLLREALQDALDPSADDDEDDAIARGVAAAAVVAAGRGGLTIDSAYGPDEPIDSVPDDLVELAVVTLDEIAERDHELVELFGESGTLETLRAALT